VPRKEKEDMSSFSIGQMNQLGNALEEAGCTAEEVTLLGQNAQKVLTFLRGEFTTFFQTREGLWVSNAFRERIVSVAEGVGAEPATVGKSLNLSKDMTDAKIRERLGDGHVFEDTSAFLSYLEGALKLQWGGRGGVLLNNGYANIFYVRGAGGEVFAVDVFWYADNRKWYVNAYRLDDNHWDEGYRAFPCN